MTAAVVDDKGNLRTPADDRTAHQMRGIWGVAEYDGPHQMEPPVACALPDIITGCREDGHVPGSTIW
jgi:hypothetical protein